MSFMQIVRPDYIPAFLQGKDDLQIQREIVLQHILNTVVLFSLGAFLYWLSTIQWQVSHPFVVPLGLILLVFLFVTINRRLPYRLRAAFILLILAAVSTIDLVQNGLSGIGPLYLLTFALTGGALFGIRAWIFAFILTISGEIFIGWMVVSKRILLPTFTITASSGIPEAWVYSVFSTVLCGVCLAGAVFQFSSGLSRTLKSLRDLAKTLETERSQLEERVEQRTEELKYKAAQLEAARQVAAKIAAQSDIDSLLSTAVNVVREQFSYYYAAVFLPDADQQFAVLRAGTGEAGQKMLERGHSLRIGAVGIVGYVMGAGEPRITGNVDEDPAHYMNQYLPETRSEMAVPMKLGDQIVGVLDVQSTRRNSFSADDVDVLQTIADQLASALDKARLLEQYQKNLAASQESAQVLTREAWQQHLRKSRPGYAYRYKQLKVESIDSDPEEMNEIIWQNDAIFSNDEGALRILHLPVRLRNQTLGVVKLKIAANQATPEMLNLLQNAVDRMSVSLDNVRLLEDIQNRAERERMVGEIATKVRAATNIEAILSTTAQELGRSLGVSEVVVQLTSKD
jgi:putative methionine-R-sulfoxide reductase with GAF domain